MSKISKQKQEKVMANIVSILFENSPEALFTSEIAEKEGRDEEFVKRLLHELEKKNIVVKVTKSPQGDIYSRRQRWRLSSPVYNIYSKKQTG